jgi:hypothetical protein
MMTVAEWLRHFCVARTCIGLIGSIVQPFDCAVLTMSCMTWSGAKLAEAAGTGCPWTL